jgi:hypothetical protein
MWPWECYKQNCAHMATHGQLCSTVMKLLHKLVLDDRNRQLAASLMRKSGDPKLRTDSCEEGWKFAVFMLCVCWHPFCLFLPKLLQGLTFLKKKSTRATIENSIIYRLGSITHPLLTNARSVYHKIGPWGALQVLHSNSYESFETLKIVHSVCRCEE